MSGIVLPSLALAYCAMLSIAYLFVLHRMHYLTLAQKTIDERNNLISEQTKLISEQNKLISERIDGILRNHAAPAAWIKTDAMRGSFGDRQL